MIIQKLARAGAHPRPPLARCASIFADLWTAIDSKSTAQPLKQWLCGDCAPTMPTIHADLRGADCGRWTVWPTHQRIMICLCVCTVKTVNGDEMNHSHRFPYSMYLRICVLVFATQAFRFNPFAHPFPQTFFVLRLLAIQAGCNTLRQLLI